MRKISRYEVAFVRALMVLTAIVVYYGLSHSYELEAAQPPTVQEK